MMTLTDPLLWITLLFLAITAGLAVMLQNMMYGRRARLKRRVASVAPDRGKARELVSDALDRRRSVAGKLKEIDASRKRGSSRLSLKQMLVQAGLEIGVGKFIGFSVVAAILAAAAALALDLPKIGAVMLAIVAGLGMPRAILRFLAKRRITKFLVCFADAIDIIVRGVRSGLPVSETFNIITREMPDPLGAEFRLIVESQRLGLTLEEALNRCCERVPSAELRFFAIVLTIQQSTGGNLAETLAKLSEVLRSRKRMRDKVAAMSSEAKASALIIGSLPPAVALLLAVMSPKYISILFTDHLGHIVLFTGACFASVGVMVMRKMINFDI